MAEPKTGNRKYSRKKKIAEGRVLVNVDPAVARCLREIGKVKGLAPTAMARVFIFDGLRGVGYDHKRIMAEFGDIEEGSGDLEETSAATA